jgi:hypothetical protein
MRTENYCGYYKTESFHRFRLAFPSGRCFKTLFGILPELILLTCPSQISFYSSINSIICGAGVLSTFLRLYYGPNGRIQKSSTRNSFMLIIFSHQFLLSMTQYKKIMLVWKSGSQILWHDAPLFGFHQISCPPQYSTEMNITIRSRVYLNAYD